MVEIRHTEEPRVIEVIEIAASDATRKATECFKRRYNNNRQQILPTTKNSNIVPQSLLAVCVASTSRIESTLTNLQQMQRNVKLLVILHCVDKNNLPCTTRIKDYVLKSYPALNAAIEMGFDASSRNKGFYNCLLNDMAFQELETTFQLESNRTRTDIFFHRIYSFIGWIIHPFIGWIHSLTGWIRSFRRWKHFYTVMISVCTAFLCVAIIWYSRAATYIRNIRYPRILKMIRGSNPA